MSLKRLTVRSCDVKFEGTNKNGNPYTMYEVAVVGEDGAPIEEEFKSFDMLPIGDLVEYDVEKEDHPTYGVSYLLRLPPGVKAGRKPNLGAEIEELRQRVARLESTAGGMTGATPTGTSSAPSPAMAAMDPIGGADDDIPF